MKAAAPRHAGLYWVLAALLCAAAGPLAAQPAWQLMARHGECAEIGTALRRKVPDIGNVGDPQAFLALMRSKGHAVSSEAMPGLDGRVVSVNVPALELSLLFATREFCKQAKPP
jgi:hypothetical protein